MGLLTCYKTSKSDVYYHISFELNDQLFTLNQGIKNPETALELFKDLQKKNISPRISRSVFYNRDDGYLTNNPVRENLTIERLEEIVKSKEPNPSFIKPIIQYSHGPKDVDIGDD
mgnify:CR=1 FL=1